MALQLKLHLAPEVLRCSGDGLEVEVLGDELPQQLRSHIAEQLLQEWTERLPGKLGPSRETVCGLIGRMWPAEAPPPGHKMAMWAELHAQARIARLQWRATRT